MTNSSSLTKYDINFMLTNPPPPIEWVVEGLVARSSVTLLSGEPGLGKSLIALHAGVAAVNRDSFLGSSELDGRLLYIDAENGRNEVHRRVRGLGLSPNAIHRINYYDASRHDLVRDADELTRIVRDFKPTFIVFDSLRALWRGDENDSGAASRTMSVITGVAHSSQAGVLVLHHTSKSGTSPYRGSTALGASAEIVATLSRSDEGSPTRYLRWHKCRAAAMPKEQRFDIIADGDALRLEKSEAQPSSPNVAALMRTSIVASIRSAGGTASQSDIARALGRPTTDQTTRRAIAVLERDGTLIRDDSRQFRVSPDCQVVDSHPVDNVTTANPGESGLVADK